MRTSSQQIPSDMGERCPWDPHLFACFRHEGCILLNQCHQFIRIKSETIEYCCSYSRACFTGAKEAQKPRMGIEHTRTGRLGMDGSPRSSEACAQLSIGVRHPTLKLVSWETGPLCVCDKTRHLHGNVRLPRGRRLFIRTPHSLLVIRERDAITRRNAS